MDLREDREYGIQIIFSMLSLKKSSLSFMLLKKEFPFIFYFYLEKETLDLRFLIFNSLSIDMIRVYYKFQLIVCRYDKGLLQISRLLISRGIHGYSSFVVTSPSK